MIKDSSYSIRVGIADDHLVYRESLTHYLQEAEKFRVTLAANNGYELLTKLDKHAVDVLLIDIRMPILNGVEALKSIREKDKDIRCIMVSLLDKTEYIEQAILAGANSYYPKSESIEGLVATIKAVYWDGVSYNKYYRQSLVGQLNGKPKKTLFTLSEKQLLIATQICLGKTSVEIAQSLNVSKRTVDSHRERIYKKLKIKKVSELISYMHKDYIEIVPGHYTKRSV